MKLTNTIIVILIALVFCSCDPPIGATVKYAYYIENNSSERVAYMISEMYPDTSVPDSNAAILNIIKSGDIYAEDHSDKFEEYFSSLPADTVSIFFFDPDTLDKYPFEVIQEEYKILKRKDFGLQYLKENDYTVSYP